MLSCGSCTNLPGCCPLGRTACLDVAAPGLGICQRFWELLSRLHLLPPRSVIFSLFLPLLLLWPPSSGTELCKSLPPHNIPPQDYFFPNCSSSQATLTWRLSAEPARGVQSPRLPGRRRQEKSKLTTSELRRNYPELVSPPTFQGASFLSLAWIHYYILL